MSTHQQSAAPPVSTAQAIPRRTVASYGSYPEAERAVDFLSDRKFPVDRVAIVGRDLRLVEQVTGRLNWGRAALNGALSGALPGLLIGWLFGLFDWYDPILAAGWLALWGFVLGAVVGAVIGLMIHALSRGRRDFMSIPAMTADRYDVVVDEPVADEAARLLAELGAVAGASVPVGGTGSERFSR